MSCDAYPIILWILAYGGRMSKTIAMVVTRLVSELGGLKSDEERERAFAGARAILGMGDASPSSPPNSTTGASAKPGHDGGTVSGVSSLGATWIKRSALTAEMIEQHFDIE